jgi:tRNA threonylcarbamoyladenosine biosynthesis protein TsaB
VNNSISPKILALDTSTEACSVALLHGGRTIERFEALPRGHARHVLGMLQDVLDEADLKVADLDAVTFCRGPGSFTGVRIGCSVVQGIAFGAGVPVVPVSTLAALAQGALRQYGAEHVVAAIDARMGQVYLGEYQAVDGLMLLLGEEVVATPDTLAPVEAQAWFGVGTGWAAYGDALRACLGEPSAAFDALPQALDCLPLAVAALERGDAVSAENALPVYLRDKVTG